ncbi:MAG: VOC family protein [Anaerolineaceae bacterium]|nr:VOC family protein [Anaerolineaceae bacterium]
MNNIAKFGFVLEYVTDIEATRRFYVDVLGLEVERYSPLFIQFKGFAIASDESIGGTRDPEVYWLVEDAESALQEYSQKADVTVPLKRMPFGKVFGIKDPSGQAQYFVEFAKERPSEPVK